MIQVVASTEFQDRLDRAIDLILRASSHGDKPDLGGTGSPGSEEE